MNCVIEIILLFLFEDFYRRELFTSVFKEKQLSLFTSFIIFSDISSGY